MKLTQRLKNLWALSAIKAPENATKGVYYIEEDKFTPQMAQIISRKEPLVDQIIKENVN